MAHSFLHALTYADSAYPSGRYTLSHGLEGLIQSGRVKGLEQCTEALLDHLRFMAAPSDGVATAAAGLVQSLDDLVDIDHELSATKVTTELRKASTRVGRQTLIVTGQVDELMEKSEKNSLYDAYLHTLNSRLTPGNQAVAVGLVHARGGLAPVQAVETELLGLAVGWSGAALRLRQCDHIGAQYMITRAHPVITELSQQCVDTANEMIEAGDWSLLGRAGPGSDLASAAHETAPARLFMS